MNAATKMTREVLKDYEHDVHVPVGNLVSQDAETKAAFDQQLAIVRTGLAVRRLRTNARLSQLQLANEIGTSQAHLSEMERGLGTQGPTVAMLTKIARACGAILHVSAEDAQDAAAPFRELAVL